MSQNDPILQVETTCGSLLYELQKIWDEVGELDSDRDRMLFELEQECLQVYRRKVDNANQSRAQLRQTIADCEAELAAICSALGERPVHTRQSDVNARNLKEELKAIIPQVEEMRKMKCERQNLFMEALEQIQNISFELYRSAEQNRSGIVVDENDLSLRQLEELNKQLQSLQKEKSDRLNQVLDHSNTLHSLCSVLGFDFKQTIDKVHPSLSDREGAKNISNDSIEQLAAEIQKLRQVKIQRMQKLQDLAATMFELWNLMDTPIEERQLFENVTRNVAALEHEVTESNTLSEDLINHVEAEVSRLENVKSSKMKEFVLKKRSELEEICRKTHILVDSDSQFEYVIEAIDSGVVDPASVLEQIEVQISNVKEEAFSRKEILEKVQKWLSACEEESWLEEYNRDDNRYNAGRGAHLTLKRAEKARCLVNKLPAMLDALTSKTTAWEKERRAEFVYDGIPLLSMLEEYAIIRQEKKQDLKREKDQKKLQAQFIAEQETLYGSKPTPAKSMSKNAPRMSIGGASSRRVSLGGAFLQTPRRDSFHPARATLNTHATKKNERMHRIDHYNHDAGSSGLSAGRRGLDIAGLPLKKDFFKAVNGHEPETPKLRKPFSPISPTESTQSNRGNSFQDRMIEHSEPLHKPVSINTLPLSTTPSKAVYAADEVNQTPKPMVPPSEPFTPSTVSVPMQTGITPAGHALHLSRKIIEDIAEDTEYSFEERRAGFCLPKAHVKSLISV